MTETFTELLTNLALPPALNAQSWLIIGADKHGWAGALTQHGAVVRCVDWGELSALADKRFDVTLAQQLFDGIRHPLLALESLCTLTRTYSVLHAPLQGLADERARLRWQESGWQTNRTALARMARSAGFAQVELLAENADSLWLKAARLWNDYPAGVPPTLTIHRAFNPVTGASQFPRSGRCAFLALVVAGLTADAQRWDVRVNIADFGAHPIWVGASEIKGCKQINAPIPPGLAPGIYSVEVWQRQALSTQCQIEIV